MKLTIISEITGTVLTENEEIETLRHDKEKNELWVNDYKVLRNASDYQIKIEL